MASGALRNSILYMIGTLVRTLASFFLLPLYTSILGASQYGQLNVLQTASIIISTCITLALERSLYRLYHDYKTEASKEKFLSTIFMTINGIGLLIVLMFVIYGKYLVGYIGDVDFKTGLLPVVLYSYVNALITFCQTVLQTKQDGNRYFLVSILFLVLYNALCIVLLYMYSPTYHSMVYASLITSIIVLPIAFYTIRKQIRFYFGKYILKEVMQFTTPMLLAVLMSWVLNFSDRLFLANLTNLEDVGLYSFAAKIVSIITLIGGAIFQSYTPYFYNIANTESKDRALAKLKSVNDAIIFLICILCIGLALIYNLLLHTVFSSEYLPSIDFFYFLLLGAILGQQTGLLNVMIYQNKKASGLAILSVVAGILSVTLNFVLISNMGRIGAAVSNLAVTVFLVSIAYILARREYYIPFNFSLLFCGVATILMFCVCDLWVENIILQLLFKVLGSAFFLFGVWYSRILDAYVFKIILNSFSSKIECLFERNKR